MSKLYFFRHAQASFGAANYDQLSPKGVEQAAILGEYLVAKKIHFDRIFVGPLQRQQHTFEIVANKYKKHQLPLPNAITLQGLKEHSGTKAMRAALPELLKNVPLVQQLDAAIKENPKLKNRNSLLIFHYFLEKWVNGKIIIPEVESWADFRDATKNALKTILESTKKSETIGAFSSGGTIASITGEALKLTDEERIANLNFSLRNTAFTSFLYAKKQFNLLSFNEIPHLAEEMITFI